MFKTRLISGILLVIAALLTIISGGYVLFFTLLCISLIGMQELYKAMKVFKLNDEEAAAIRWHMGEYNVASNEVNELHAANERYPLVQMLQFADRLSIVKY